jgi:hypothetical protein
MSFTAEPPSGAAATVRDILGHAKAPVTFPVLAKQSKFPKEVLQQTLAAEEGRHRIFGWPGGRSKRFWSVAPADFIRTQILETASECALPAGELVKLARKKSYSCPEKLVRSTLQQLIRDKELRKYPSFGRESNPIGRTGHPAAYAEAARRFKEKIDAKVLAEGGAPHVSVAVAETIDVGDAILEAMRRLEPSSTAPVSVRELHASLPAISKAHFDAAALALRSAQKVFLSQHDYPRSLSPEDRDLLIDGQDGTYYVAITAIAD